MSRWQQVPTSFLSATLRACAGGSAFASMSTTAPPTVSWVLQGSGWEGFGAAAIAAGGGKSGQCSTGLQALHALLHTPMQSCCHSRHAGTRRKLQQEQEGSAAADAAPTTLPNSALVGSPTAPGSGSSGPDWVKDDPVWQVAARAASSAMGSEAHSHGSGGNSARSLDPEADAELAELLELWANHTAGGGDDEDRVSAASVDLPAGGNDGLPAAADLREYDGSEDLEAEEDRARAASASFNNSAVYERERQSGSRVATRSFEGPSNGTVLSWL